MDLDPLIRRRLYNLQCIKSLVTLALTGLFVYLAATGQVNARDFITIFSVVIAFYFGTQAEKRSQTAEAMTGTLVIPDAVSESDTKGGDGNGNGAAGA